jgi:hypothetical protein
VQQPADPVTLRAQEGEARLARLAVYAPSRTDGERRLQVVRWYVWLVAAVQEAKRRLKQRRTRLLGHGPPPPTRGTLAASSVSPAARDAGETWGDGSARQEPDRRSADAGSTLASVAAAAETSQPRGGQRPGTGRLGAEACGGAERVECRHATLAVGQRCPVCGPGTF